jgi:Family of unknown function (DUF6152)
LSASARRSRWLGLGLGVALAAAPASAHHSAAAAYAADHTIVVKGKVLAFAWTNPHCHAYIDVAAGPFTGRTYTVELGSPAALAGDGWTKASLRPGDDVVMTVHPSRTGAASGLCRRCALSINGATWRGAGAVE